MEWLPLLLYILSKYNHFLSGNKKLGDGAYKVNSNTGWIIELWTEARLGFLCIGVAWEGIFTTYICMINLWTLALQLDWTHCILLRTACQLAQSASIYIWEKLQLLELCHGSEDKKSFVSCHLGIHPSYLFYRCRLKIVANNQNSIPMLL